MQIVIEMPENDYNHIREYYEKNEIVEATYSYIYYGTVLPEHGDLIDRKALLNAPYENDGFIEWYDEIKYAPTILEGSVKE